MSSPQWVDYPMFEYEKVLARREIESLVGREITDPPFDVGATEALLLRDRATFMRSTSADDSTTLTAQAATEDHHRHVLGRSTKRQSTRFLVHGLHEYKGKFNPQLARVLVNVVDPSCTALIDPYCGSGTTLIEGMRLGLDVAGLDKNPLAAWLSEVKVAVMRACGQAGLEQRHSDLVERIVPAMSRAQENGRAETPPGLDEADADYLLTWFPEPVLAALSAGLHLVADDDSPEADVIRLTVSSLVRSVSWQMPEDLRVRRRPPGWVPPDVSDLFAQASRKAGLALKEVSHAPAVSTDLETTVVCGASQDTETLRGAVPAGRSLVVTSPPYATALPYIDTDRLSIVLLALAPARAIRPLEHGLTGSREWSTAVAREWSSAWHDNRDGHPQAVLDLLGDIDARNQREGAGFRRAAVPALLYRYFSEVGDTLDSLSASLRPGERAVFVVGNNRTGKKGSQVSIDTPSLLGAVAQGRGFVLDEIIPLETWPRYGMHASNGVSGEKAVVLTASDQD